MKTDKSSRYRLDERNHVEKPLLDQLYGLGNPRARDVSTYRQTQHWQAFAGKIRRAREAHR